MYHMEYCRVAIACCLPASHYPFSYHVPKEAKHSLIDPRVALRRSQSCSLLLRSLLLGYTFLPRVLLGSATSPAPFAAP